MKEITVREEIINLIRRYGLTPVDLDTAEPKICVRRPAPKADQPAMIEAIKSAKPEIIAYWRAQEEARKQETREKKEAIRRLCPGMDELAACARSWAEWHEAEQAAFEGPDGVISLPPMPAVKYSDLAAKYPTAAAYRHAEAYSRAENYRKAAAGREAMRSILAGEDVQAALEKMENWLPADAIWG